MSKFQYYSGNEAEQYSFYRLPKMLFTDNRFKGLSDGAKILYGLMLDRMGLSVKNGWTDEQNRVYIFFTLDELQEYMNCGHNKGVKLMDELDGIGLIERVKQGQGKPTIIYMKKFFVSDYDPNTMRGADAIPQDNPDFRKGEVKTSENRKQVILIRIILSLINLSINQNQSQRIRRMD